MLNYIKLMYLKYCTHVDAVRIILIVSGLGFLVALLGNILVPIFISIIIAHLLDSIINKLTFLKLSRKITTVIVMIFFITMLVLFLVFMIPFLWEQMTLLIANLPHMLDRSQYLFNLLLKNYSNIISTEIITVILASIRSELTIFSKFLVNFSFASISSGFMFIIYLFLIPVMIYYFLADKERILLFQREIVFNNSHCIVDIVTTINNKIGSYIKGKLLEMIIVILGCFTLFKLFYLDFSFLLAFLVGISVFIPVIGAVLVTIPIVVVAFFQWGFSSHFFYLIGIYFIILAMDGYVLVPLLFAEVLNMRPLIIILAILIFGGVFGLWGMFLAIPLAIVIATILQKWPQNEVDDQLNKYII